MISKQDKRNPRRMEADREEMAERLAIGPARKRNGTRRRFRWQATLPRACRLGHHSRATACISMQAGTVPPNEEGRRKTLTKYPRLVIWRRIARVVDSVFHEASRSVAAMGGIALCE